MWNYYLWQIWRCKSYRKILLTLGPHTKLDLDKTKPSSKIYSIICADVECCKKSINNRQPINMYNGYENIYMDSFNTLCKMYAAIGKM